MTAPGITYISARTFPRTERYIDEALQALTGRGWTWACRHVMAAGKVAVVCVDHPRIGLLCRACMGPHDQRHDYEAKHRCDACGEQSERMHNQTCTIRGRLKVRVPRGTRGVYVGPIILAGLGACPACLASRIEAAS